MKILIYNVGDAPDYNKEVWAMDLVIEMSVTKLSFVIVKNRYGPQGDEPLPISLLQKVILNPGGSVVPDWK